MSKCEAKGVLGGVAWKCDRAAELNGLCPGHDMQLRRDKRKGFSPLRDAHGSLGDTIAVSFSAPADHVKSLRSEAKKQKVSDSEVYRQAFAVFAGKLKP